MPQLLTSCMKMSVTSSCFCTNPGLVNLLSFFQDTGCAKPTPSFLWTLAMTTSPLGCLWQTDHRLLRLKRRRDCQIMRYIWKEPLDRDSQSLEQDLARERESTSRERVRRPSETVAKASRHHNHAAFLEAPRRTLDDSARPHALLRLPVVSMRKWPRRLAASSNMHEPGRDRHTLVTHIKFPANPSWPQNVCKN